MTDTMFEVDRTLKASEVSALIGVPVPTIRSWERRYGWPNPSRTYGGHRRYTLEDANQLRLLRDEVARGTSAQQAVILLRRQAALRRKEYVDRIVEGALLIDQRQILAALRDAISSMTTEQVLEGVVLPALKEIGIKWERGTCDVAGEHAASTQIRQWIGEALDRSRGPTSSPTVVLSTGPADFHSIGLEVFAVFLARRGLNPLLLGSLTPVSSVVHTVNTVDAAAAVVTCHMAVTRRAALESLRALGSLPGVGVYYAGNGFAPARARRNAPGAFLGTNMTAAADLISREALSLPAGR